MIRLLFTILLTSWLMTVTSAAGEVSLRMSSRFLARGEQALLEVVVVGFRPTRAPELAPVRGVLIQSTGQPAQAQVLPDRRIEYCFSYVVSSHEVGTHRIEAVRMDDQGETLSSEPLDFSVFNSDMLTWNEATVGDTTYRYASAFLAAKSDPYVGENVPVEIKLYLPSQLYVVDWGIPDFERTGLTAWRMQPSQMRSQVQLLGRPCVGIAYPSTLCASQPGEVAIGPADIRLMSTQVVLDGIPRRIAVESHVQVPALKLNAKPLPPNAPTGFRNAVGRFRVSASIPETRVREGDPIPLEITVSGTGNLDTLEVPQPINSLGWKVYEAARQQRGEQRGETVGSTVFQQLIRPLELKSALPVFRLVYLNPDSGQYEVADTEPIQLQMTPAAPGSTPTPTGPPPALGMPPEEMTDILGLIPGARLTLEPDRPLSRWWVHGVGAALALLLISRIVTLRLAPRLTRDPQRLACLADLRQLERATADDHRFLMDSGRFIERWLGGKDDPRLGAVLTQRDLECFSGKPPAEVRIETQRRREILQLLRQSIHLLGLILILLVTSTTPGAASEPAASIPSSTGETAYREARYDQAIKEWLSSAPYEQLSPDTLYHIGNACYRCGSPGYAALYYRRALAREPGHAQSLQNLRFIERKYGSLSIQRPSYHYLLARLPLRHWYQLMWGGLWLTLLGLLVIPATRSGSALRPAGLLALIFAPILAICGGIGVHYFPNDAAYAPIEQQAVIVGEQAALHTEASRNSTRVIDAPPGSLCQVLQVSGKWSYVSFATKTCGWILTESLRMVIVTETPELPRIHKPLADETNA